MTRDTGEPQLQPPGAGLPRVELFVARVGFRVLNLVVSRRRASAWFRAEADRMLGLVRALDPERAARRVLVPRLAGLEDSSRYWSAYMVLEHLVLVDTGVRDVIGALVAGAAPGAVVNTADFKPAPTAGASAVARFEAVAREYLARVDAVPDLRTKVRFPHPWFGPLSAIGWHRLAAMHHRIHRKQLERIVRLVAR
ncbi:MAG: DinB family protein [Planctomycetes bacterium]|nr:DinB family protein [Planctomycetota bacterium]